MILYFDNYITDLAAPGAVKRVKDNFRSRAQNYRMPSRLEISKYALASYAPYPWTGVLIKYQIDDPEENQEFASYAESLFPHATLIKNRSATQAEYKKSLQQLEQMPDEWIFFAPNNDHILLLTEKYGASFLDRLVLKAENYRKQQPFVSIAYSHLTEYQNVCRPTALNFEGFGKGCKILEESEDLLVYLQPGGDLSSVQILHKDLFRHLFTSVELGEKRVIRLEDLPPAVRVKEQVVVVPKKIIGAHFEGYEHMLGGRLEIRPDQIPSLFIPPGFFEKKIRFAYGYKNNRPGWVNINPGAKKYSFEDIRSGTDLKIGLKDIPIFWQGHIAEIDINPKLDQRRMESGLRRQEAILRYPWSLKAQGVNLKTLRFWLKRPVIRFYPLFSKLGLVGATKKIGKVLGFY